MGAKSLNIFSKGIFQKWLPKRAKEASKKTRREQPKLDRPATLQEQFRLEDGATPTIIPQDTKREQPEPSPPLSVESNAPAIDDWNDDFNCDQDAIQEQSRLDDDTTTIVLSHVPRLPVELFKPIIDNLSDDQVALRACSLTCRAFLYTSRHHIFHTIRLTNGRQARRFLDKICFTEASSHLSTYVRYLYMSEGEGCIRSSSFVNETLPLIAVRLPNVTELELDDLNWILLGGEERAMILFAFQKVQKITMRAFFDTSQQANEFIASFPSLTTLTCWKMGWKFYSKPVIPLPRGLKFITLCSSQSKFFEQLLRLEPHPDVSSICFRSMNPMDTQAIGELLKMLASHLNHLKLYDMNSVNEKAVRRKHIDLSHNTHLCSIHLHNLSVVMQDVLPFPGWVSTLFSQISSPYMKYVTLRLIIQSASELDGMGLAAVDRVCTQPHWANLWRLDIVTIGPRSLVPQWVKARLPILDSWGIVHIRDYRDRDFDPFQALPDEFLIHPPTPVQLDSALAYDPMPEQHIRLAKANIAYGPPTSHSSSYTGHSLFPFRGQITPLPRHPPPSSHTYPHHPRVPMQLDTARTPKPLISYDISLSPHHISGHYGNIHAMLAEPATQPPLPQLTIIAPRYIPWAISVSPMGSTAFVTMSDVITAIYRSLRQRVSEHDYQSHRTPSHVRASFEARCHRHRDLKAYSKEKIRGVRRIDFFLGKNQFLGLSPSRDGPHIWFLHVK